MAEQRWIVTAANNCAVDDVSQALSTAGFSVDQVLKEIGCITGSASNEVATRLRKLPGIADVSPDSPVDVGPPGSHETW